MLSHPVFNRLGEKLVLLASDSTPIDLTSPARAMLDRRLTLRLEHGRLACMAARATGRLHASVVKVACSVGTGPAATLALQRNDDLPPALATLTTMACWWPERDAGRAIVVLMHILEPDTRVPILLDALRALFGLTLAEARVARSALDASGLSGVAEQLGIRVTTARTHLQHIFEKTGTKRQSQLVRLLLSYSLLPGSPSPDRREPRAYPPSASGLPVGTRVAPGQIGRQHPERTLPPSFAG